MSRLILNPEVDKGFRFDGSIWWRDHIRYKPNFAFNQLAPHTRTIQCDTAFPYHKFSVACYSSLFLTRMIYILLCTHSSEVCQCTELPNRFPTVCTTRNVFVLYGRAQISRLFWWGWRDTFWWILRCVSLDLEHGVWRSSCAEVEISATLSSHDIDSLVKWVARQILLLHISQYDCVVWHDNDMDANQSTQ